MAKLQLQGTPGFNAGNSLFAKSVRLSEIIIDPDIANVFSISEKTLEEIKEKIKNFGYNKEEPVVIWKGRNILVDGRTRYTAAKDAGLEEIPAVEREFENKEEAVLYTIERQVLRRNLTGAEILKVSQMLPGRRNRKGEGRAAEELAERIRVSPSHIYQAQKVAQEAPPDVLKKVESGEMSIKAAYKETTRKPPPNHEAAIEPAKATAPSPGKTSVKELIGMAAKARDKVSSVYFSDDLKDSSKCLALLKDAMEWLEKVESGLAVLE